MYTSDNTINDARKAWPKTVDEWETKLAEKSLLWLSKQVCCRGNGVMYDTAILNMIKKRQDAGECILKGKEWTAPSSRPREEDVVVQHVPFGPKGQTIRVEVPHHLFTG